jgi:hypothetical protein
MKRTALIFGALFIAATAMGSNEKYYEKMSETLKMFGTCKTLQDYQELANRFRVIANVQRDEWLPLYYEAQCHIMIGFMIQLESDLRDSYLERAATSIDNMIGMAPGEAELYVLKAFCYTGQLVIDPSQRAMGTTPLIHAAIARALEIEPDNPRAKFLLISNELGTAAYFGNDTAPLCEKAARLLQSWDDYQLKSPIYPDWGKNETEGIVRNCGL